MTSTITKAIATNHVGVLALVGHGSIWLCLFNLCYRKRLAARDAVIVPGAGCSFGNVLMILKRIVFVAARKSICDLRGVLRSRCNDSQKDEFDLAHLSQPVRLSGPASVLQKILNGAQAWMRNSS